MLKRLPDSGGCFFLLLIRLKQKILFCLFLVGNTIACSLFTRWQMDGRAG
jgi:hypothetical protein